MCLFVAEAPRVEGVASEQLVELGAVACGQTGGLADVAAGQAEQLDQVVALGLVADLIQRGERHALLAQCLAHAVGGHDADGDAFGDDQAQGRDKCLHLEGFSTEAGDCDDADPDVNPDAFDVGGNGIDEDCSGDDAPDTGDTGWVTGGGQNCSCSTARSPTGLLWLGLPLAVLLGRRRRRRDARRALRASGTRRAARAASG